MAEAVIEPDTLTKPLNFLPYTELASSAVGGTILYATDDFFAPSSCLISPADPVWDQDRFTSFGKWMDGWETRRKRTIGHDWCILRLGLPGRIHHFELDTAYFTGNQTPAFSIQGYDDSADGDSLLQNHLGTTWASEMGTCASESQQQAAAKVQSETWPVLAQGALKPGYEESRHHSFDIDPAMASAKFTHLRINYFPDGGVARLRVFGIVDATTRFQSLALDEEADYAAVQYGGRIVDCSNKHYGLPNNLITFGRAANMAGGWETARNPNRPRIYTLMEDGNINMPGTDYTIIQLGRPGRIQRILIDTNHFKGNYPESCFLEYCLLEVNPGEEKWRDGTGAQVKWKPILPRFKLKPHIELDLPLVAPANVDGAGSNMAQCVASHVRLTIYPDGGVSRLRVFCKAV